MNDYQNIVVNLERSEDEDLAAVCDEAARDCLRKYRDIYPTSSRNFDAPVDGIKPLAECTADRG